MRWLRRVFVLGVVLVAAMAGIGWMLPKGHVVSRTTVIAAAPLAVYTRISEVPGYPRWWRDVSRVETLASVNGRLRYREHMSSGAIIFEIAEMAAPHRFVSRIADPDQPFGGTWTFELTAEGSGTRVTLTERGEVYNPIFRFLSHYVFSQSETIESCLAALASSVSAG
jgi:uncharacterized protein YndB with AHSA1/START domain